MDFNDYVHVVQDAGALVSSVESPKGFYTDGVESCLLVFAMGDQACAFVHDSGQLKFSDVLGLIRNSGKIRKIFFVQGELASSHHRDRIKKMIGALGVSEKFICKVKIEKRSFDFAINLSGDYTYASPGELGQAGLKDKNHFIRSAINRLNYFFLPRNSKDLSLDVQYRDDNFQPVPHLRMGLDGILYNVKKEPQFIELNLRMLYEGHESGVFNLPIGLLSIIEHYGLKRVVKLRESTHLFKDYLTWLEGYKGA